MEAPIFSQEEQFKAKKYNMNFLTYRWRSVPSVLTVKQKHVSLEERYLHAGQVYDGKLYIHGGVSSNVSFKDNRTYSYDILSQQWKHLNCHDSLQTRDSHGLTIYDNKIISFGGSTQQQNATNKVSVFDPLNNAWKCLDIQGQLPCQRQLAAFTSIQNQFVLMFGGVNYQKQILFDDSYIFKRNRWFKLNVINEIPLRLKFGITVCGNRIFMHGGQGPGSEDVQYYDDIYEITIQQIELQISFTKIKANSKDIPLKRSCHGMISLSNRYFSIYGGETESIGLGKKNSRTTLNDVWIYDIYQRVWQNILPEDLHLQPRREFLMKKLNHKVIIFGGFENIDALKNDTTILEFRYNTPEIIQQCEKCITNLIINSDHLYNNNFSISTGFLYNMFMSIRSPFQAIQKIIQFICDLNSSYVKILSQSTTNTQQQYSIFTFNFDGILLSPMKFLEIASCLQVQEQFDYISFDNLIMMLCARLGKTVLFVQNGSTKRNVMLFSIQEKYSPQFESNYVCYKYIQEHFGSNIQPRQGQLDKSKIISILSSFVTDPHGYISEIKESKILIFSPNIYLTSQKAYYYELIFPDSSMHDVILFRNQKRTQFLSKLNFKVSETIEFSLRNYLMNCWQSQKQNKIKIYINNTTQCLNKKSYIQYLNQLTSNGKIKKLKIDKIQNIDKAQLFYISDNKSLPQNNGILVYKNGLLVNRFIYPLGELLPKYFYKKKYRTTQNPFPIAGVVHLSNKVKLINFGTSFKKTKAYNIMKNSLQQTIDKFILEKTQSMDIQKITKDVTPQVQSRYARRSILSHEDKLQSQIRKLVKQDN